MPAIDRSAHDTRHKFVTAGRSVRTTSTGQPYILLAPGPPRRSKGGNKNNEVTQMGHACAGHYFSLFKTNAAAWQISTAIHGNVSKIYCTNIKWWIKEFIFSLFVIAPPFLSLPRLDLKTFLLPFFASFLTAALNFQQWTFLASNSQVKYIIYGPLPILA